MKTVTGAFWDKMIAQSDLSQGHAICSPQALDATKCRPKVQAHVRQHGVAGLSTHLLGERLLERGEIEQQVDVFVERIRGRARCVGQRQFCARPE